MQDLQRCWCFCVCVLGLSIESIKWGVSWYINCIICSMEQNKSNKNHLPRKSTHFSWKWVRNKCSLLHPSKMNLATPLTWFVFFIVRFARVFLLSFVCYIFALEQWWWWFDSPDTKCNTLCLFHLIRKITNIYTTHNFATFLFKMVLF